MQLVYSSQLAPSFLKLEGFCFHCWGTWLPGGPKSKETACNAGDLIWSLGQEDPLEKGLATHSSILAWRIPWTEEPGRLQSMGLQRVGRDWVTNRPDCRKAFFFLFVFPKSGFTWQIEGLTNIYQIMHELINKRMHACVLWKIFFQPQKGEFN